MMHGLGGGLRDSGFENNLEQLIHLHIQVIYEYAELGICLSRSSSRFVFCVSVRNTNAYTTVSSPEVQLILIQSSDSWFCSFSLLPISWFYYYYFYYYCSWSLFQWGVGKWEGVELRLGVKRIPFIFASNRQNTVCVQIKLKSGTKPFSINKHKM